MNVNKDFTTYRGSTYTLIYSIRVHEPAVLTGATYLFTLKPANNLILPDSRASIINALNGISVENTAPQTALITIRVSGDKTADYARAMSAEILAGQLEVFYPEEVYPYAFPIINITVKQTVRTNRLRPA